MSYSVSDLINDLTNSADFCSVPEAVSLPEDADELQLLAARCRQAFLQRLALLEAARAAYAVLAVVPMPLIGLEHAVELLDKAIRGTI